MPSTLEKFKEIYALRETKAIVLQTMSLRGIRKTYKNCNNIGGNVQIFDIPIDKRDVLLHLEFQNELGGLMGKVVTMPRLFIKGRYIEGANEVSYLHEEEMLKKAKKGLKPKEVAAKSFSSENKTTIIDASLDSTKNIAVAASVVAIVVVGWWYFCSSSKGKEEERE